MNCCDAVVADSAQSPPLFVVERGSNISACYQRCSADILYSTQQKLAAFYTTLGALQLSLAALIFVICSRLYRGTFCGSSAYRSCVAKRLYIVRWLVLCHLTSAACGIWRVSHGQGSFACSSFQGKAVLGLTYDPRGINPECFANLALTSFANSAAALWWLLLGIVNFTGCTGCVQEGESTDSEDVGSAIEAQATAMAAARKPRSFGICHGILHSDVTGWTGYVWLLSAAHTAPLLFVRAAVGGDELTGSCTFQPPNGSILGLTDSAYHATVLLALCVCLAPLGAARLQNSLRSLTCNLGKREKRLQETTTNMQTNPAFQSDYVEVTGEGETAHAYLTTSDAPEQPPTQPTMNQSQSSANRAKSSTQQALHSEPQEGSRIAAASVEKRQQQQQLLQQHQQQKQQQQKQQQQKQQQQPQEEKDTQQRQQPVASVNGASEGRRGSNKSANRSMIEFGHSHHSSEVGCGDTDAFNITVSSLSSACAADRLRTRQAPSALTPSCVTPGGNLAITPRENLPADQTKSEAKRSSATCTRTRTVFVMCILLHIALSVTLVSVNTYVHISGIKAAKVLPTSLPTTNANCFELSEQTKLQLPSLGALYGKIFLEQIQAIALFPFLVL